MKQLLLKKLSERLEKLMLSKKMSPKELAKKAKISYSSLMPILNGARECGISKLISIANALEVNPDTLLQGMYSSKHSFYSAGEANKPAPKFLAVFISIIRVTYCLFYDVATGKSTESALQFPLRCGDDPDSFINNILSTIERFVRDLKDSTDPKDVAVFASVQQYGRRSNREKIQNKGNNLFSRFIIESDALTNHKAFIQQRSGICVSINDGSAITYSADNGETITRLQGYGFPVSDTAGNYWIGCEAIKHVIKVKANFEKATLLSDKVMAALNDDIDFLYENVISNPTYCYSKASAVTRELVFVEENAYQILKKSADLLVDDIQMIDQKTEQLLPIFISGELAYLYINFFPNERLLKIDERQSSVLLLYGLENLKKKLVL